MKLLNSGNARHLAVIGLVLLVSLPAAAQKKAKEREKERAEALPAEIWKQPIDADRLNLIYGAGGANDAPDPNGSYKFLKEDLKQTSPKFDVEDDRGRTWRVKLGQEPQSETAATRLLWAAGYFVDEDYYLPQIKVSSLPRLHRGEEFVTGNEIVHKVRLERRFPDVKKLGQWDWFDNQFRDTRELNGLRVMMALLNNWDLNPDNNSIYELDGKREFLVSDVGATFGKTGNFFSRSKSRLRDYEGSKFIAHETPEYVDFVMHTRPFFLSAVRVRYYEQKASLEKVAKHIPRADAKWLGERLGRLSESQIRDCFRAAGYAPDEIDGYAKTVQDRIQHLKTL
jgi:hypothetical protein